MIRRFVLLAATAVVTVLSAAVLSAPAGATTVNCAYSGPIVGNPGMQYVCYVVHDDGSRETFYAPGPRAIT
ncbi:hypothetical protein NRB56_69040 [Nocardia sp. RB56]|uniref:Secreted protein n=1 Tax=Nocardia aurantia TaxID=2585199 RepID=A0A7K0DZZ1_9NOCA|nr:hypothetical protein [Nocardia aurantia]